MRPKSFPRLLLGVFAAMVVLGMPGAYDRFVHEHLNVGYGRIVPWGLWVAAYMFLAGVSAGAFLVSTFSSVFRVERFRPLTGLSLFTALVALAGAMIFVTADLGRPERALNVLIHPQFNSVMAWLVWLYAAYGLVLAAQLALLLRAGWAARASEGGGWLARCLAFGYRPSTTQEERNQRWLRAVGAVGLAIALAFPGCAGALLAVVGSRPFWHTGLFPVTFVIAALVSGGAMVYVLALLLFPGGRAFKTTLLSLSRLVGVLLAIEFVILTSEILIVRKGAVPSHVAVLETITQGRFAWVFWVVQVGFGTLLPLGLLLQRRRPTLWTAGVACLLILAGAFALRLNLLIPQQTLPAMQLFMDPQSALSSEPVYVPTWMEWNFLVFGMGLAGLLFLAGYRLLPLGRANAPVAFEAALKRERAELYAEFASEEKR